MKLQKFIHLALFALISNFALEASYALELDFLSPQHCEASNSSLCQKFQGRLQKWDQNEIDLLKSKFPTDQLGLFKDFRTLLEQAGVTKIIIGRSVTNEKNDARGLIAEAHYKPQQAFILIHNNFYKTQKVFINGVSESTHSLIHEMVHLFNQARGVGEDPLVPYWKSLADAIGWENPRGRYSSANQRELKSIKDKYWDLYNNGQVEKAVELERQYSLVRGVPSFYSIGNGTNEFIAEVIAHLIHQNEVQKSFSPELIHWLAENGFSDFVNNKKAETAKNSYIETSEEVDISLEHLGVMYLDGQALCTTSLIRHGLIVTARHCLASIEDFIKRGAMIPGLTVRFPYAAEKTTLVGLNFKKIILDSETNDLAFLEYEPAKTSSKIAVPNISIGARPLPEDLYDETLLLASYRQPLKTRPFKAQLQSCHLTNEKGYLDEVLPKYRGEFNGSNCRGYYLSSGAPYYVKRADGALELIGVLGHTFAIDDQGDLLPNKVSADSWGLYTDTNLTLISMSTYLASALKPKITMTQEVLVQAVEQKLREYAFYKAQNAPSAIGLKVQLRVKINIAKSMGVTTQQIKDYIAYALGAEQESLLEEEQVFSPLPLDKLGQAEALAFLTEVLGELN